MPNHSSLTPWRRLRKDAGGKPRRSLRLRVVLFSVATLYFADSAPAQYQPAPTPVVEAKPPAEGDAKSPAKLSDEQQSQLDELLAELGEIQKNGIKKVDPNVANIENQYQQYFQTILNSELHFISAVCELTPPQRQQFKTFGEAWLKTALRMYAEAQIKMQHGQGVFFGRAPGRVVAANDEKLPVNDPQALVRFGLSKACDKFLSAEQASAYDKETELRNASRKKATIQNMIAELDRNVVLSAQQREQLVESLDEHWQDGWSTMLPNFVHGAQFIPALPNKVVKDVLNDEQRKVHRGNNNNANQVFLGGAGIAMPNVQVEAFDVLIVEPAGE